MNISCPNCGNECQIDVEPVVGQHMLCPFCQTKFAYSVAENQGYGEEIANVKDAGTPALVRSLQAGRVDEPVDVRARFCTHCGAKIPATAKFCSKCGNATGTAPAAEPKVEDRRDKPEPVTLDLSDDAHASLNRWLDAISNVLIFGFGALALGGVYYRITVETVLAGVALYVAGLVLISRISNGSKWARVSTYVIAFFGVAVCVDLLKDGMPFIAASFATLPLAAVMLLLPNVSSKLKKLGQNSKPYQKSSLLFWGLIILWMFLLGLSPQAKGLKDYDIPPVAYYFVGTMICAAIGYVWKVLFGDMKAGALGEAVVTCSRWRNAPCPKCGQIIVVPDTDDNDKVICGHCGREFYPFGYSMLANISWLLALPIITAPIGLWAGKAALKDIKAHRGKHGITRAWFGVVVCGTITGFFAVIFALSGIMSLFVTK